MKITVYTKQYALPVCMCVCMCDYQLISLCVCQFVSEREYLGAGGGELACHCVENVAQLRTNHKCSMKLYGYLLVKDSSSSSSHYCLTLSCRH